VPFYIKYTTALTFKSLYQGVIMSHYTQWNLSEEARIVTGSLFKVQKTNEEKISTVLSL